MVAAPLPRPLTSMKRSRPVLGYPRLDIVAEFVKLPIRRLIAEIAFYFHDNSPRPGGDLLRIHR